MILPTGTTVAVVDGETVRLFHNTGVKPGVHLVEITAAPPAAAHSGSGARHHRLCQPRWEAARRGRLRGSYGRVPEQAKPGRHHKTPGRCLRPQDAGRDAQTLPPRPERQDHGRVREGSQPASARGYRLIDRQRLTRLWSAWHSKQHQEEGSFCCPLDVTFQYPARVTGIAHWRSLRMRGIPNRLASRDHLLGGESCSSASRHPL